MNDALASAARRLANTKLTRSQQNAVKVGVMSRSHKPGQWQPKSGRRPTRDAWSTVGRPWSQAGVCRAELKSEGALPERGRFRRNCDLAVEPEADPLDRSDLWRRLADLVGSGTKIAT